MAATLIEKRAWDVLQPGPINYRTVNADAYLRRTVAKSDKVIARVLGGVLKKDKHEIMRECAAIVQSRNMDSSSKDKF